MDLDNKNLNTLINLLLFNIGWSACALGGDITAVIITLQVLLIHLLIVAENFREISFIALVSVIGLTSDVILFNTNLLTHSGYPYLPPIWMICMWPVFATTLKHGLSFFHGRLVLAVVAGAIGGMCFYYVGMQLSEVEMVNSPWVVLPIIGLDWGILFPLFIFLAQGKKSVS